MFTGNIPYMEIFKISLDIKLQISWILRAIKLILVKIQFFIKKLDRY